MTTKTPLTLYFSPLACSFASRAVLYDVEADVRFVEVRDQRTEDGADYRGIHPLGLVPALHLEDGELLTESQAILVHLADRFPERGLAPPPSDSRARARLLSWLSFVGMELHKAVFVALLDEKAPAGARSYALGKAAERLGWLATKIEGRTSLLDRTSVADAYLAAILNWAIATPVNLGQWPAIVAYHQAVLARPAFARALAEERALWFARNPELARRLAAAAASAP
jgi:glutathione S-transferase